MHVPLTISAGMLHVVSWFSTHSWSSYAWTIHLNSTVQLLFSYTSGMAVWMETLVCLLVSLSATLVQTGICWMDPWNFVQTLMAHRGWILLTLMITLLLLWHHHEVDIWGFLWKVSNTIGCIAMKFGTDICVPPRMNCNNFGDPYTFPVVPPWGQICNLPQLCFVFSAIQPMLAC